MKTLYIALSFLFFTGLCFSQETTIKLNTIKDRSKLLNIHYAYRSFLPGKVYLTNKSVVDAQMNYNRFNDKILFIDAKKDTLELANLESIEKITISVDTFYHNESGFTIPVTNYKDVNLAMKPTMKLTGTEKKGSYDTYTSVSNIGSYDFNPKTSYIKFGSDENFIFSIYPTYYLTSASNKAVLANKKNFLKLFSNQNKALMTYLKENNINFTKKEDLQKLLQYAYSLN